MKILKLINNEATEENILKIIQHIKDIETAEGLTQQEIEHKYTCGYCSSLVEMVQHFLPQCRSICFWSADDIAHFCIGIEPQCSNSNEHKELDYFDINGKKSFNEMAQWLAKEFNGDIRGIRTMEMPVSRENKIQQKVYNSVHIEQTYEATM